MNRYDHAGLWKRFDATSAAIMLVTYWAGLAAAAPTTYRVNFDATWSATTFPTAYPGGAHFSALIGGVHNSRVNFWKPGDLASPGIELMAERGGTSLLRGEVQAALNAGQASAIISGGGVGSPGSVSTTFEVTPEFPLATLVTMVAPSPDWFVGVHDLDLRQGSGWVSELVVNLAGYDSGTDDGLNFTSADIEATPHQPIALLGAPFTTNGPILGRFTFTRLTAVPEPATVCLAVAAVLFCSARRFRDHQVRGSL